MGLIRDFFSGSSAAGKVDAKSSSSPTHASGPPAAATGGSKPNVWRSVFDPGSNPNTARAGSGYYDTVHKAGDNSGTTWDMILRAQDFSRRSFSDIDRNKDGYVDAHELKAALPPSMKAADTAALIQQVKPANEGRLTRKEYTEVLDKYFLA